MLLCTMAGMFCGHLTMAVAPKKLLLGTIIIGFSFGGIFGTAPVFVAETFGKPHFGKLACRRVPRLLSINSAPMDFCITDSD